MRRYLCEPMAFYKDQEIYNCNGNKEIDCVECIEGGRALLANDILQKISECEVKWWKI